MKLRILVFGAHEDDCDIKAGGFALKHTEKGNMVKFISATNGNSGHHEMGGGALAKRRYNEAMKVSKITGIEYEVWDINDGELMPTIENRIKIIKEIRLLKPDLVLTHRIYDYHPDHRYLSQLIQDASFLVTVPNVCPFVPHLKKRPVIIYLSDSFTKPNVFTPDIVISIDEVIDKKIDMLDCHESQMYEWLPYNQGILGQISQNKDERKAWLMDTFGRHFMEIANKHREKLLEYYGTNKGMQIKYAEAFEVSEYGDILSQDEICNLIP